MKNPPNINENSDYSDNLTDVAMKGDDNSGYNPDDDNTERTNNLETLAENLTPEERTKLMVILKNMEFKDKTKSKENVMADDGDEEGEGE